MLLPLLLETIRIDEGKAEHLYWHQKRFDKTREALFPEAEKIDLASLIDVPDRSLYRCRIVYGEKIQTISYLPYHEKNIRNIKIVPSDLSYPYKYENRDALTKLLQIHSKYDEIIIEKEGYLSDTSIANLAFYDGSQWFTPENPLLEGTVRARLLHERFLQPRAIKKDDIMNYQKVALMNAMIGFKTITPKIFM